MSIDLFNLAGWIPYETSVAPRTDNTVRPSGWCGHQRDTEFHQFVDLLLDHACESILFIGVANGGNQLYIARRYQEAGLPCMMRMVDIRLNLGLAVTLKIMREECPFIFATLTIANSSKLSPDDLGTFDAAFVDGDHGYPQTLHDVRLADACVRKFTGAHDVTSIRKDGHEPIPSVMAWEVLKEGRRVDEFFTDHEMGIGVLYKE